MEFITYPVIDENSYKKEYILEDLCDSFLDLPYLDRSENQVLDIYIPKIGQKPYPTMIYIHGGGLIRGDKTRHINPLLQGLRYGYALACINYRLASEAPFPAMIYDVTSAIRYLKANSDKYHLDKDRFLVWGETHGSYLGCLVGVYGKSNIYNDPECEYTEYDASVAGIVDYWAFNSFETSYLRSLKKKENDPEAIVIEELIFGKTGKDLEEDMKKYPSPYEGIKENMPPFYILHGEFDSEIPRDDSIRYYEKLKKYGNEAYLEIVPETEHGLPNYKKNWQIEGTYKFIHKVFKRKG